MKLERRIRFLQPVSIDISHFLNVLQCGQISHASEAKMQDCFSARVIPVWRVSGKTRIQYSVRLAIIKYTQTSDYWIPALRSAPAGMTP